MSEELEAVGAMATAGLAASVLEPDQAHGKGHGHGACANCGTALVGSFCHACGQVGHVHRSMLHIVEEFFHGILHFDGKVWHTLPALILWPGRLTRDYIMGHRVRYVSPLALFLFTVFMMFMVFSLAGVAKLPEGGVAADNKGVATALASLEEELVDARAKLDAATVKLAEVEAAGGDVASAKQAQDKAQADVADAQTALDAVKQTVSATAGPAAQDAEAVDRNTQLGQVLSKNANLNIGNPALEAKIKHKLENPDLLLYKLQNTAYKFSWILIPISLPFLWLLFFWRRDVVMYDHAIFALYSLSFMSLLFIVLSLLLKSNSGWASSLTNILLLAPPVHMFFHLKGTYALGVGSALWRTFALLLITAITSTLFLLFILSMGVLG
ncbi:DUF3667 domain-containing protein [Niveispirillum sp. SYP-B3756]|uniref:DUF3667 domain-containing protein n=1 Tax=Niveispirillum sp. SYP-B3756 TaxID=2662178 RepID=UPI0012914162|nr:DUF3667 domain-containing protein [Niveispirillum sp. SYP-B3756]MQP68066.1 DUF3667 domain-containing protein [Niveispirillum sp. SYP-B3756]